MAHKNETSPRRGPSAGRRDWVQPRMRHLKTSAAEFGAAGTVDAEGLS